jgi:hypothetical protein
LKRPNGSTTFIFCYLLFSEFRIASGLNGDVWICGNNGKIYKQFSGVGSYVDQEQIARNWKGITVNLTNGDVYATVLSGIYVLKK